MKIADMHCDTISELWDRKGGGKSSKPAEISPYTDSLRANNLHIDLQKMKQAGYTLQNFAMYINLKKDLDPFAYVLALIDLFDAEMEQNKNDIRVIKTYEEITQNERNVKISAFLSIEVGGCCKG